MKKKVNFIERIRQFLFYDLWQMPALRHSFTYRFIVRPLRIFFVTFKEFFANKVQIRASALTYNTMLSIVPVLALVFGIAQGFGLQQKLEAEIIARFHQQQEVLQMLLSFVRRMLARTQGGIIAGVGVIVLLWSVMRILASIESAFNDIWQVKKARTWTRKFSDYLSIMLVAPVFLIASSSATVFLTTHVSSLIHSWHLPAILQWLTHVGLDLIPYVLIWLTFTIVYMVFPNTRVKFFSALAAGILAGTTFQILQWGYVKFQLMLSGYGAIYGSFAALPLFMIWLQLSWTIVLFGAELSYAIQHIEEAEHQNDRQTFSLRQKNILLLYMLHYLIKRFAMGEKAMPVSQIASSLQISTRLATDLLYELQCAGLVTEVVTAADEENAFQPAIDINRITVAYALNRLMHRNENNVLPGIPEELHKMTMIVQAFEKQWETSKENILIKDL